MLYSRIFLLKIESQLLAEDN